MLEQQMLYPWGSQSTVTVKTPAGTLSGPLAYQDFFVLDRTSGKEPLDAASGAQIAGSPITYRLDGHQVVLTSSGGVMFAWTLPWSSLVKGGI